MRPKIPFFSFGGVRFALLMLLFAGAALIFLGKQMWEETAKTTNGNSVIQSVIPKETALLPALLPSVATKALDGESEGRINMLVLGIGGEGHIGELLTDTILLISTNTSAMKIDVFSIPRDLAVRIPGKSAFVKINSLYLLSGKAAFPNPGGMELLKQTVEQITGLPIQYYAIIDFQGVVKIIDLVDGISIPQDDTIFDSRFPAQNRGYQTFEVQKGWRYLNGSEALKYVRTRNEGHGDFDRMRRQHIVLTALKQKIMGLVSANDFAKLLQIYQTVQEHIATNGTIGELQRLWQLTDGFSRGEVEFHVISSEPGNLLVSKMATWGTQQAYILQPKIGAENYEEIKKFILEKIND